MKMLLEVLYILIFVNGFHSVIHGPQQITKEEGNSVTFECHLDQPEDLSNSAVDCKQVDENFKTKGNSRDIVHSYRGGYEHPEPQMDEFINRTRLNRKLLKGGILSVEIISVQASDSGNYKCSIPNRRFNCTYTLSVVEEDPSKEDPSKGDPSKYHPSKGDPSKGEPSKGDPSKGDPSPTKLPAEEVTTPDGGDTKTEVIKYASISAGVVAVIAVIAVIIVIFVLRCLGALPRCTITGIGEWFKRRTDRQNTAEMTPMNELQQTDGHEDPHSAAENGYHEVQQRFPAHSGGSWGPCLFPSNEALHTSWFSVHCSPADSEDLETQLHPSAPRNT